MPAWTASPAPDRQDGTPEAPVQFAHQTVRQDMRLGASAEALRFRISNELGDAPLHVSHLAVRKVGQGEGALPVLFNGRSDIVVPVGAALISDPVSTTVVEPGWQAEVSANDQVLMRRYVAKERAALPATAKK